MSESRPFPASPRRLAEARRAGRVPWSPALVAGAALGGGAIAVAALGRAWADAAGAAIARGATASHDADPIAAARAVTGRALLAQIVELAAPLLLLVAATALVAHLAQTRGLWLPRRLAHRLPAEGNDASRRTGTALLELARAAVVAAAVAGVLVSSAAILAGQTGAPARSTAALAVTLLGLILAHAAIAAIALGVLDWLERARRHHADLAMSARDQRDERRDTEGDPRWRRAFAARGRDPDDEAVRRALVVVVADDRAAVLAWHPRWQPVPLITAAATGRAALRLSALARRHRVAIHRDVALATDLTTIGPGTVVPERLHGDLAHLVVALETAGGRG